MGILADGWDKALSPKLAEDMSQKGFSVAKHVLTEDQCEELKGYYTESGRFRKTIVMERFRFGMGEYKYFNYPLPELVQELRENVYSRLAPIANEWMNKLDIKRQFHATHAQFLDQCMSNQQDQATVLMLKYGEGGYNRLHQDLYGDLYFPLQAVLFLSEAGKDYTGGEFVLTEQLPRAQSKAIVLSPSKSDMLVFTTQYRPVRGSRGYFRVNMKHGVSEIHSGERQTLGIIFHDAKS